jgi:cytochrome b involved in lipid metabolism
MRKATTLLLALLTIISSIAFINSAQAHQPVILNSQDTTASKGPLLVDGTVSFAVRATFAKSGQTRGFRAQFKAGDSLAVQYLIVDRAPENRLKISKLPTLTITSPSGLRQVMKLNERTKFFEPYGQTNYLYLGRLSQSAESGIYSFSMTARAKAAITVAVGEREVPGEVIRGALPVVTPTPSTSLSPTPTPIPTPSPTLTTVGYTKVQVAANNTRTKCWSIINDNVYDLTKWIKAHPGGQSAITFICGIDGTNAFLAQHRGQASPFSRLASFYLGPYIE